MKRLLFAIATVWLCIHAAAQPPHNEIVLTPLPESNIENNVPSAGDTALTEHYSLEVHQGITAGYLHSTARFITQNGRQRVQGHPGFTIGWNISIPFADVWSFDTGLMFSMWGFRYETTDLKINDNRYVFEIPTTLTFFESDAYFPIFLQAGIVTGVCAGGKQHITSTADTPWTPPAANSAFPRLSVGLVFGIGYDHFAVQFIHNFTNLWSRDMAYSWESYTQNTIDIQTLRALTFTYTYWF